MNNTEFYPEKSLLNPLTHVFFLTGAFPPVFAAACSKWLTTLSVKENLHLVCNTAGVREKEMGDSAKIFVRKPNKQEASWLPRRNLFFFVLTTERQR